MYTTKKLINCHIELSNYCNAACAMCGRHRINGKTNVMTIREDVDTDQLSVTQIKKIFDTKFFETFDLGVINMCGNRGDPITTKHLLEICAYIQEVSPNTKIKMATNGGLRTPKYWAKIGEVFAKAAKGSSVTFGLDGLEDTNHIYRQRVKWKKCMENSQAFIDAGGDAKWQYLIFKHNEHQLDEAYDLSVKMGFSKFVTIHTPRFAFKEGSTGSKPFTYKGKNWLLETADPKFADRKEARNFIASDRAEEIDCKANRNNEFYIDCRGRVIPCCWLGGSLDHTLSTGKLRDRIIDFYDVDEMSAIQNDLTDILLKSQFINEVIPMSWDNLGKDCAAPSCKTFCSKKHNLRKETVEYTK